MEEHPLMGYGDLDSLRIAILEQDIDAFRQTLQSSSDVEKDNRMSTFERACQRPLTVVDIDTPREGEARALITELLPELQLPPKLMPDKLPQLFQALMVLACEKGLASAVERMLRLGADINAPSDLHPIERACIFGSWEVLEVLLKSPKLDLKENVISLPLITIFKFIGGEKTQKHDHEKWFKKLLEHQDIDINETDLNKCSALHYAIKYNQRDAILALLEHGAYIGGKSRFGDLQISDINPKMFESYLDTCITSKGIRAGDPKSDIKLGKFKTYLDDPIISDGVRAFEIQFDYRNLVPGESGKSRKKWWEVCLNEMTAIEYMSKSDELRHLIQHPLISSFLFLKWNRLAFYFYVNFLLCLLFAASTVSYILYCYNEEPHQAEIKNILRCITAVLLIYVMVREIAQFIFTPRVYLNNLENYLEWTMIVLVVWILFDLSENEWRRTVAATTILMIALEIFLLASSLPFWSFSIHYVMLKTVTWSFLKSLSLYAIIFIAFSLSFFTLLREHPKKDNADSNLVETTPNCAEISPLPRRDEDDEELNKFKNLGLSMMKTLVMATGEFDAASINFQHSPWSYFIFIAFLFIVSTVLLNLLNGLAVSDTQAIKSGAELTNLIRRCQVISRYETALLDPNNWFNCPTFTKYISRSRLSVLKDLRPVFKVCVKPYDNNKISIPQEEKSGDIQRENCNSCFGEYLQMEDKIVKHALAILDKAQMKQTEQSKNEGIMKNLELIMNKLGIGPMEVNN